MEKGYVVMNNTDSTYASPDLFETRKAARDFIRDFRKRFTHQGYYLTVRHERIPVKWVDLEIVPMDAEQWNQ